MFSCNGRVIKAFDLKSFGILPRRFEPCSQRIRSFFFSFFECRLDVYLASKFFSMVKYDYHDWMMINETKPDQVFSSCVFFASNICQTVFKVVEQYYWLD